MGTDATGERDRLTDRERQILEHLEQAQSLGVPLTEYASVLKHIRFKYACP
jgi:hypothetical protein